jgi:hypothetical protein
VRGALRWARWLTIPALCACSATAEPYTTDAETGSKHALVHVSRDETVGDASSARAGALAGFVQIPATVDERSAMRLVGLGFEIPEAGQCAVRSAEAADPATPDAAVELLEAGDVTLDAAGSRVTLTPRALPTFNDLLSGVLYTTRDRDAAPLPAGAHYIVRSSGAENVSAIVVAEDAPRLADSVTVGGVPLTEIKPISINQPIDLTWTPGSASDDILVQLSSADGGTSLDCAFRDESGVGTIPAQTFGARGVGTLTIRRIRVHEFQISGLSRSELRFDFGLTAGVSFTE